MTLMEYIKTRKIYNTVKSIGIVQKYSENKTLSKRKKSIEDYGLQSLVLMREAFAEVGHTFWLDYGTLLGAVREKDFIGHDADIDLGTLYLDPKVKVELEDRLRQKGFIKEREFNINERTVEETYIYNGVYIDVFYYFKDEKDKVWCYFFEGGEAVSFEDYGDYQVATGWKTKKATSTFVGETTINFKGEQFTVPSNYEQYLIDNYGPNYMIKDENWDSSNSGTNINLVPNQASQAIYWKKW